MKFLALDTASAQCSVALVMDDAVIVRERRHGARSCAADPADD